MLPRILRLLAILGVLFAVPAIVSAGVNMWTGGRPANTSSGAARSLVAAHPDDPDIVYATFAVGYRSGLYRSVDGGRSWRWLRLYEDVTALLVHPASPSTIYIGVTEFIDDTNRDRVYKSTDAGETWTRVLDSRITVFAGSPADPSVVLAGAWSNVIYKTGDGGATWSAVSVDSLSSAMASLILDPREPETAYAGVEGYSYWGLYPGGLFKTTDGGDSWERTAPEVEGISAIAVDSAAEGALYVATGVYWWSDEYEVPSSLLRSDDGGETWRSAAHGLSGLTVRRLVADAHVSGTLYAGTSAGIFRTRDGGRSWAPFGQRLAGVPIRSLTIDRSGRRLLASTPDGLYGIEIALGALDVAAGPGGETRLLVWDGERNAIATLDASGGLTEGPPGQPSSTWTAIALAESGGRAHVLWHSQDDRSALEIVGSSGRESVKVFPRRRDWMPTDVSVRSDGQSHVLWTGSDGRMFIAKVSGSGAVAEGPSYGPAPGWSAVAMADGSGGDAWVLWRAGDGRFATSLHRDGVMVSSYKFAAESDWAAKDLAIGADGRPRILRTNREGAASVGTIDGAGRLAATQVYVPEGFTRGRIAAGSDGRTRLLFGGDGHGELLLLNPDNTLSARHALYEGGR